jgi:uncharacterized membrane protein
MNGISSSGTSGVAELPDNVAAMLAAIIPPITGITFYLLDKNRSFVRFYAMQNIILGIVGAICWIAVLIFGVLSGLFYGIFLLGPLLGIMFRLLSATVGILYLVLIVFQVYKAWKNEEWEIPFLGKQARNILAKG